MRHLFTLYCMLLLLWPAHAQKYKSVEIKDTPFEMKAIPEYVYPDNYFSIRQYGAKADGKTWCTKAIEKAIRACHKAGGGHVIVPQGDWLTGPIHLMDNIDLHLEEGARLIFSDNPTDYLPAVLTTWEGIECMNYSPLVYAFECRNIKISGKGTFAPRMDKWKEWFARPKAHIDATAMLYKWGAENYPVEERRLTDLPESNMRPHLIQLNRCQNVVLENFSIRESPFWTIHIYMCENCLVRGLDVSAHGHNNDGIDIDMTRNILVENCHFDQGDDAVVIKSGRNADAWRLNSPTENVVVRNCVVADGHTLLGIGSEISGGVRNVWMHDCKVDGVVTRLFYVKTNHRRGGFVENILMENIHTTTPLKRIVALATDIIYQWKDFPDYEKRYTKIQGIHIRNVSCASADIAIDIQGDTHLPARDITIENLSVGKVNKSFCILKHAENVIIDNANITH